jgi:hypothetical protein
MVNQDTLQLLFGAPIVEVPAVTETSLGLGQGVYVRLFWSAYLGSTAFALWDVLQTMQGVKAEEIRPLTVDLLAQVLGCQRAAILGRKARNGRKAQEGALAVLLRERIAWHATKGKGQQTQHQFRVLPDLPILTPKQARTLPHRLSDYHEGFLGAVRGFDLPAWRDCTKSSYVGDFS